MRLNWLFTTVAIAAVASTSAMAQTSAAPSPAAAPAHVPLQKTIGQPAKPAILPSMIVFNSRGASLQGQKLTLTGISPNTVVFADRPIRAAGHDTTAHIIEDWSAGNDSFAKNPPNATISVFSRDAANVRDAVVVLKSPKLAGDTLTFDVDVLEGDLAGGDGSAALFIDMVGLPWTPMSSGTARRDANRAAWYRGLATIAYAPGFVPLPRSAPVPKTIGVPSKQTKVSSLIVLDAANAKLNGQTLTLGRPQSAAILFSDRPVRSAGHLPTAELVDLWKTGSFAKDPPNATVSVFGKDGASVRDAVLTLKQPRLSGDSLTFDVAVLEGGLGAADGPAALFIDTIWFGVGSGGIQYLGRNQTTGGIDPNIGSPTDTSAMTGWSNPAPNAPPPPAYRGRTYPGLVTPPELGGDSQNYRASCGAPPLLPCY